MKLAVKVVPGASREGVSGWLGNALKLRVSAPPEGGLANRAVVNVLARRLNIPVRQIRIVAGFSYARKTVEIDGLTKNALRERLSSESARTE